MTITAKSGHLNTFEAAFVSHAETFVTAWVASRTRAARVAVAAPRYFAAAAAEARHAAGFAADAAAAALADPDRGFAAVLDAEGWS